MKIKSIILYAASLAAGLLLGWLIFGRGSDEKHLHEHESSQVTEYTCSMHPQIRQNEPGKCPLCGMDLTPLTKSSGEANPFVIEMTESAIALGNIQTTRAKIVKPGHEISLTGRVKINEQKIATLTAKFPGRIEKLFVNFEGQVIRQGEKLASIYSPELINAQRELLEAGKMKQISPELYTAAKEKLRFWKISERQIENIESAGEITSTFDVYAEASGVVSKRLVSLGDYVSTGSVMAELADLSSVWIVLDAYESDLPWIKTGSTVKFTVLALPAQEFTAKIAYINPVLNPDTRSVDVRAVFDNRNQILKPETLVNAKIQTATDIKTQAIAIPASAVLWTGKRSIVYVKKKSDIPSFERRVITLGSRMGDLYLVEKGLEAGEEVVYNGVFSVDAAAQLSGNYSMMHEPEIKSIEVPEAFRQQLTKLAEKYFVLKNALVKSDVNETAKAAPAVELALNKIDMKLLDTDAHNLWMPLLKAMQQGVKGIQQSKDVELQHEHFQLFSNHLIEAVELFGLTLEKTYRAYCPMAFDDAGAYWLSEFEEIRNPYFGDAMLKCGENRAVYKKGEPVFATNQNAQTSVIHTH
ncbi:MAG TPA: efflux RND transporter periplasmic adaptor subunit [Cyclobacteriaceae bacterium]|nr:efflux RND transporter periplasmic adaptor subunit [Cyclobacteriaceae bacterium]